MWGSRRAVAGYGSVSGGVEGDLNRAQPRAVLGKGVEQLALRKLCGFGTPKNISEIISISK
jgi:hypothetical protein